jgi:hypothetical protein
LGFLGTEQRTWSGTFAPWCRERLYPEGAPADRVREFQQQLRDAGRPYCADYIDEAFKLYGIDLTK